jgi:hypothetical protein
MPAPQMIETPAMRRSAMLAKLLEEQRQPVEIKGGYGELAARLLGQGITQFSANRAERAVRTEREQRDAARRDALLGRLPSVGGEAATPPPVSGPASVPAASPSALAEALSPQPITNTQEPRFAANAPAAVIEGAPLPPPMPAQRQTLENVLLAGVSPPVPPVAPSQPTTLDDALLSGPLPMPQGAAVAAAPMPAAPQAMPAPPAPAQNPRGPTPQEIALIQQAAQSGDPGQLAWAEQTWGEIQMRMATPPEINIAIAPDGTPYNTNDPASLNQRFRSVEFVNGFAVNRNDPNVVGQYFPDLQPGEEPLYDQNGNVVGVRNLMGAIQALGERVGTEANARNRSEALFAGPIAGATAQAQAPYQIERVIGPNGETIAIPRSSLLAAGGVQGQTPAAAIIAEGAATQQVQTGNVMAERVRQAPERILRYEEALALIPKAITGFAADARVATARGLAATGNQDAQEAVAATEIYQNLIGRDVGAIVREMVGSTQISTSDRELAERIAGGDTNITPQALTRIVNYELSRQIGYLAAAGRPISEAQARRLPRGTVFIGEDGQRYRAP